MNAWEALGALVFGMAIDGLATLTFHYTQQSRAFAGATVNIVCQGLALFVFVDVSKNPIVAIPYLAGLWIGGVLGIKLKSHLEKK